MRGGVWGEEGVEDAQEAGAVVFVEFGELVEAFGEAVVVEVKRAAGDAVDDEVVEADVERLGDVGDRVEAWGDVAV